MLTWALPTTSLPSPVWKWGSFGNFEAMGGTLQFMTELTFGWGEFRKFGLFSNTKVLCWFSDKTILDETVSHKM